MDMVGDRIHGSHLVAECLDASKGYSNHCQRRKQGNPILGVLTVGTLYKRGDKNPQGFRLSEILYATAVTACLGSA